MALLELSHLSVEIPTADQRLRPVRDVSFQVEKGRKLCIVGESGCGKSLTSLAIMGLLPKSAERIVGKLHLEGEDLLALSSRAMEDLRGNKLAMIFQEPMTSLNPSYTIGNQLEEVMIRHRSTSRRVARERALYLLERVGITGAADRLQQYPHQLSGGLRQRVMIAMALMCEPRLLIADEPTTALDVTIQAQILHLLSELCTEFQMGLILITHDLGVVSRIADDVAVMYAGQIVEMADVREIFTRPVHPYTRALLKCIPVPGKVMRGQPLGSIPGTVPRLTADLSGCGFANRCAHTSAACAIGPELIELSSDHLCRCVLAATQLHGESLCVPS